MAVFGWRGWPIESHYEPGTQYIWPQSNFAGYGQDVAYAQALKQIPAHAKELMRYAQNLTTADIAEVITGSPTGNIGSAQKVASAVEQYRDMMGGKPPPAALQLLQEKAHRRLRREFTAPGRKFISRKMLLRAANGAAQHPFAKRHRLWPDRKALSRRNVREAAELADIEFREFPYNKQQFAAMVAAMDNE